MRLFRSPALVGLLLLAAANSSLAATNAAPVFPRLGMLRSTAAGMGTKAEQWARYGIIVTWKGCRNMAVDNPEYIEHIVRRIEAVVKATEGRAGIFLDNLRFEPEAKAGWTSLLTKVCQRCGDVPILVNSGWDSDDLDWVAPFINGIMYEDSVARTEDFHACESGVALRFPPQSKMPGPAADTARQTLTQD